MTCDQFYLTDAPVAPETTFVRFRGDHERSGSYIEFLSGISEMMKNLVPLITFSNRTEANLCVSLLESHGVKCFLYDENTASNFEYLIVTGYFKIVVQQRDLDVSSEILREHGIIGVKDVSGYYGDPCPKCSSQRVNVRGYGVGFHVLNVFLFYVPYLLRRRDCSCGECGYNWKSPLRSHNIIFAVVFSLALVLVWSSVIIGVNEYLKTVDSGREMNANELRDMVKDIQK